jgi:hypothetical protein
VRASHNDFLLPRFEPGEFCSMTVGSDGCTFLLVHMRIMRNGGSIGSRPMRITAAQKYHLPVPHSLIESGLSTIYIII